MIDQRDWIRSRKILLDQVKAQVQLRLGPATPSLKRYARDLEREFGRGWRPASAHQVFQALQSSRVVLGGDFHAYAQSQRAHLRLLRALAETRPLVLVLEAFPQSANADLKAFLRGQLSESRLLAKVAWDKNWGFPWENYRPLVLWAKAHRIPVLGLRGRGENLARRDQQMSQAVIEYHKSWPDHLFYCVVGEWHLAESHMPRILRRHFSERGDLLVMFQDVERLFFQRHRQAHMTRTEYLRAARDRYCMMVSPPWMKWQSYLMYLEHTYDRDLEEDLVVEYTDHVASLVQILARDLRVKASAAKLQVYGPNSRLPIRALRSGLSKKTEKGLLYYLEHELNFFLSEKDFLFLARPTINSAATLAGQFLHAQLSHRTQSLSRMPAQFKALIWVEAVGFFFSKSINPKRKAESWDTLRHRLQSSSPKDKGQDALLLALDQRLSDMAWSLHGKRRKARVRTRNLGAYLEAARLVGQMVGEKLFQGVRSGRIRRVELMRLLRMPVGQEDFDARYREIIESIDRGYRQ
ncbi:MAG: ChaN family lipoprotein [Bdellovibrionales bacterium]